MIPLSELSFKNTSGRGIFCKRSAGVGARTGPELERAMIMEALTMQAQFIQCKASDGSSYYFSLNDFKKLATDGILKVNYDQDIMEEYDDSYETKFAEKTEKQKIDDCH